MSVRVAVVGNINIDFVLEADRMPRIGETLRASNLRMVPGGKGANQAVAAARLGAEVTLVGRVGADVFGQPLLQSFAREHVNSDFVRRDERAATGAAFITITPDGQNSILSALGANLNCSEGQVEEASEVIENTDILMLQLGIPPAAVDRSIQIAVDRNVTIVLDPSPLGEELPQLWRHADIMIPNETEIGDLTGTQVSDIPSALSAATQLASHAATMAVITLGAQGCLIADTEGARLIRGYPVQAVDTTAAGDAFAGALAVRIAEGASVNEAAVFANAAGALAATVVGAQPSLPFRQSVERFLERRGGLEGAKIEEL